MIFTETYLVVVGMGSYWRDRAAVDIPGVEADTQRGLEGL